MRTQLAESGFEPDTLPWNKLSDWEVELLCGWRLSIRTLGFMVAHRGITSSVFPDDLGILSSVFFYRFADNGKGLTFARFVML